MKSYTDIEQSKKLAEILPLESSDMRFCFSHTLDGRITGHYPMIGREPSLGTIPCWSLAALFSVLKNQCNILEIRLRTNKEYNVFAIIGDFVYSSFKEHSDGIDMIDGLYELTLMLNKEKLL